MKEEKPKLVLNKRTVARLNNLEMRHVRGGDGGETDISRGNCGDEETIDKKGSILQDAARLVLSMLIKVC